jgi:DNA recombination protein RmuC
MLTISILSIVSILLAGTSVYLARQWIGSERMRFSIEKELATTQQKLSHAATADDRLKDTFQSLATTALTQNNQLFLDLAATTFQKFEQSSQQTVRHGHEIMTQMMTPLQKSLEVVDHKISELEKSRIAAYHGLTQHVSSLVESQKELRQETTNLSRALRNSGSRGRWGEIQLRRVVEMAGMIDHCDFFEQTSTSQDGQQKRPDLIVRLPANKTIVVDAKTPLSAYLEAIETTDEPTRQTKLTDHATQVRRHITSLSQKSYWDQFQPSPEFVILFIPSEAIFSAALERSPDLIEFGVEQKVILATPTTLIALLRAVAFGWRQEAMNDSAQKIADLGRQLHQRMGDVLSHIGDIGKGLNNATKAYNSAIGSIDRRMMVTARKFEELGVAGSDKIDVPKVIENWPIESTSQILPSAEN